MPSLIPALMYASIFGNVGALIQRLYSGTARYHAQMLRIKEFIRFHQIPSPLRQRLEEYSTQVWEHTNGIDMTMVQYSFPESLQSDICLYVYKDFLNGSPAFKSLNDGCLRNISLRIRAAHMPPSDTLIHTGDLLTAVYYVVKGSLEVVTTDDLILGVLNPGDYFGGLPTLVDTNAASTAVPNLNPTTTTTSGLHMPPPPIGALNAPPPSVAAMAMASPPKSRFAVRALTYADVQFIDRHDLADLCHVYPELCIRLLEHFELTIPLVSPHVRNMHMAPLTSPWLTCKSSLEAFLASNAGWNSAPPSVLALLTPLCATRRRFSNRLAMNAATSDLFNPSQPVWVLERLQRLFDHGALCDNGLLAHDPPPVVHPGGSVNVSGHSTVGVSPTSLGQMGPVVSPKQQVMRRVFANSRSPPTDHADSLYQLQAGNFYNPSPPSAPCSLETVPAGTSGLQFSSTADHSGTGLVVHSLLNRFGRVESQIQHLDERISNTLDALLVHLQTNTLHVPSSTSSTIAL